MTNNYFQSHHRSGRVISWLVLFLLAGIPSVARAFTADTQGDPRLASSHWGANYFPNVQLVDHHGNKLRFFDDLIEDKVFVINFIYTRCPDACPLETSKISQVQEILGDRVGQDVFIYSISIDPEFDTPEVMARYAQQYRAGPGWLFLTGESSDITLLRKKLGLYIDEIQTDPTDHNLSLKIGNQKTGRWMTRSPFANPYVLATEIGSWLHNYTVPKEANNYADAPKLRKLSQGESMFRTRCAVCHSIGQGDGLPRSGPNLLGITDLREHDWLVRWIKEPDVMLEEKDPLAMDLFNAYNKVPMPNMQLSDYETNILLDFIETESRRVRKVESVEAMLALKDAEVPSCCQKDENLVLGEDGSNVECPKDEPGQIAQSNPGNPERIPLQTSSMLLGCALGLLAFALKRRENVPQGQES